jgi:hypothetical protein
MDARRLTEQFSALSPVEQTEALVQFSWELTLVGREAYEPGTTALRHPRRLREVNEVQHRVSSHIRALLAADPNRYPDDVLIPIFLDGEDEEFRSQVAAAFARSLPHPVAT